MALIIGGTGLVGRAIGRRMLAAGWEVDLTGRDPTHLPPDIAASGGTFVAADRGSPDQLLAAFGNGADLLVDCICFTAEDATRVLPLVRGSGSTVMISSKAVYVDAAGNHSNSDIAPNFETPIRESQPTLSPGIADYSTREGYGPNKVAAENTLLDSGCPVTVLRPSKIHGSGATRPREWVFVKRVLDRRAAVFLSHRGSGIDHPTAAANIAALVEVAAAMPGQRILNSADPDAPSALEISRTIARQLDHIWDEVLLDEPAGNLGRHPWDAPHPIILDMAAATTLGYVPAGDYAATVADEVQWLVSAARGEAPEDLSRVEEAFFRPMFDYVAEDRYLASRAGSSAPVPGALRKAFIRCFDANLGARGLSPKAGRCGCHLLDPAAVPHTFVPRAPDHARRRHHPRQRH